MCEMKVHMALGPHPFQLSTESLENNNKNVLCLKNILKV
jgi:hypothetical protein